jgi:hypothetical protein
MRVRVYVLLDITTGKSDEVAHTLRSKTGVRIVDVLESPPDVVMVVEAPERQKLAQLTIRALNSVEDMTEGIQLLPAQDGFKNRTILDCPRRGNN